MPANLVNIQTEATLMKMSKCVIVPTILNYIYQVATTGYHKDGVMGGIWSLPKV